MRLLPTPPLSRLATLLLALAPAALAQEPLAPLDTPEGKSGPDADVEAAALFGGPIAGADDDATAPELTAPAAADATGGGPIDLETGKPAPLVAADDAPAAGDAATGETSDSLEPAAATDDGKEPAATAAEPIDLDVAGRMGLTETARPFDSAFVPKPTPSLSDAAAAAAAADPDRDLIPDEDVPAKTGEDAEIEQVAEEYLRASRDLPADAPAAKRIRPGTPHAAGDAPKATPKRM
jgi:hypothetical protein